MSEVIRVSTLLVYPDPSGNVYNLDIDYKDKEGYLRSDNFKDIRIEKKTLYESIERKYIS